jgi:mediator of RNA polymerase II transcription subunit 12
MDVVSEQLRLLAHITEPTRDAQTQPPTDPGTQDEFLLALARKIEVLEAMLSGAAPVPVCLAHEQLVQHAILLARLLQFDLACRDIWTPAARGLSGNLCAVLFRLAMVSRSCF